MHLAPVQLANPRLGPREAGLLLLGAGFALLMMDLGNVALVADCAVLGIWLWSLTRGPRASPALTIVYGAGLFVTCFWWPREGWWPLAIALTWTGIALVVIGLAAMFANRVRKQ